jgi:hypothetical protein
MAAYDEALAQRILQELQEVFPNKVSSAELKAHPPFAEVRDEKWLLALDALFKLGHIDGNAFRAGYNATLHTAANLEITLRGRENLRSQSSDGKWTSYYLRFFEQFGLKFYQRWKGKIVAGAVGAVVGFLVHHSPEAWTNQKSALRGVLLGVGIFAIGDLFQTPWLIHKKVVKQEQALANKWSAALGMGVFVLILSGLLYLTSSHWIPKTDSYAISTNDPQYPSVTNALHAFRFLASQSPNCTIRLTAPPENRNVAQVLSNFAGDFCKLDWNYNPADPQDEILRGAVDNMVVVHMAKEPPQRDGFITELGNVFSVQRTYELPPGSPPEFVWIQVGHGSPWRKKAN